MCCTRKPNSVLSIIYLGELLPTPSSSTTREIGEAAISRVTALHTSKDLAVSTLLLPKELFLKEESIAFLRRRLCSHLVVCTRRELPATYTN